MVGPKRKETHEKIKFSTKNLKKDFNKKDEWIKFGIQLKLSGKLSLKQ